jgi:hypothetical protein
MEEERQRRSNEDEGVFSAQEEKMTARAEDEKLPTMAPACACLPTCRASSGLCAVTICHAVTRDREPCPCPEPKSASYYQGWHVPLGWLAARQ